MRDYKVDYIKGVTIFLVVYGHCIQFLNQSSNYDFFKNPIFILIYMFHMPLFMLISGYFAYKSTQKDFKVIVIQKFNQLIIPIFSWVSLVYIIKFFILIYTNSFTILIIKDYVSTLIYSFWFLWVLFECYLILIIGIKYLKNHLKFYLIIVFLFILFLPDKFLLQYLKFMYPYFIFGYFYHKNKQRFFLLSKKSIITLAISFIILFIFWKKDYYIYITGMNFNIPNILLIMIYRYLCGFIGSLLFINIIYHCNLILFKSYFLNIGLNTMGIYIIQSYLMEFIRKLNFVSTNPFLYNFFLTPLLTIIVIFLSMKTIKYFDKNKFLKYLFLGKFYF